MSYLEAFRERSRQNPPADKIDKTAEIPPEPYFGKIVNIGSRQKTSERVPLVSAAGASWSALLDWERKALLAQRGLAGEWVDAAGLWSRSRGKCFAPFAGRWQSILADAEKIVAALPTGDCWVSRLKDLGWNLLDIWGVHEGEPRRHKSLILAMGGRALIAATQDTFTLRGPAGETLIYRHDDIVKRVPIWELIA